MAAQAIAGVLGAMEAASIQIITEQVQRGVSCVETSLLETSQNSPHEEPPKERINTDVPDATGADAEREGKRLASHLDMLAETVRSIVTRVMDSTVAKPPTGPCAIAETATAATGTAAEAEEEVPHTAVPTRSEYPLETRQKCVEKHAAGASYKQIALDLEMPVTSVQTIVQRAKQHGGTAMAPTQRTGRPRSTPASVETMIRDTVEKQPQWSARQVHNHVQTIRKETTVSFETVRRRVREYRKELSDAAMDVPGTMQNGGDDIEDDGDDATSAEGTVTPPATLENATKRRKRGSEYSPEFRELCVQKHQKDGQSYQSIAEELEIPPDSVRAIVRKAKRTGTVVTAPRSGRPRKTTDLIDKVILQSVKNGKRSTAKQIQDDLATIYQVTVSCETIRRRARDHTKQRLQATTPTTTTNGTPTALGGVPQAEAPIATRNGAERLPVAAAASSSTAPDGPSTATTRTTTGTSRAKGKGKRKRCEYPLETREKCISMHAQGLGYRKIGDELQMPHTTVRAIVEKVQRTGTMTPAPRSGRPRKTDEILDKVILQSVKMNEKSSARMIQEELALAYNVTVSCETIRRRVKDHMKQKHLGGSESATATPSNSNSNNQRKTTVPAPKSRSSRSTVEPPPTAVTLPEPQQPQPQVQLPLYHPQQSHLTMGERPMYHHQQHQPELLIQSSDEIGSRVPQSLMDMMTAAAAAVSSDQQHSMAFLGLPPYSSHLQSTNGMFSFTSHLHQQLPHQHQHHAMQQQLQHHAMLGHAMATPLHTHHMRQQHQHQQSELYPEDQHLSMSPSHLHDFAL